MVIALGLLASILVIAMGLTIKRKNVVRLSLAVGTVTTAQYLLLGEWGTAYLTAVAALYAFGLMYAWKVPVLGGKGMAYVLVLVYTVGFFAINGVSFSWSLLAYGASIFGTLLLLINNPLHLKYAMLINGLLWTAFQLISGAYGQIPGEAVYVAGVVFSIIMLTRAHRKGKNLHDVPEFTDIFKKRRLVAA